ncbi:hypothetical protein ACJZ2D_006814 [Fusarium nematophilum]
MARLSGLQKEVLALYRSCLRESRKKPLATRPHFENFARNEFARNLSIDKRDFAAIEFLLRKGRRQLEVYASPGIKDVSPEIMASASGPVSSGSLSPSSTRAVRAFSVNSFERPKSRPRAVIVSRRPSRARNRRATSKRNQPRASFALVHQTSTLGSKDPEPLNAPGCDTLGSQLRRENGSTLDPDLIFDISDSEPQHGPDSADIPASVHDLPPSPKLPSLTNPIAFKEIVNTLDPTNEHQITTPTPASKLSDLDIQEQAYDPSEAPARPSPSNPQGFPGDATYDSSTPMPPRIDDRLVAAISRNISQQLQMLSVKGEARPESRESKKAVRQSSDNCDNESRTPSQREALNRFTQDLRRYAEQTGARGKLPVFTPTPPHSGATLHTVSELLPFRSEFKAAGLAVTSKDQARHSSHPTQAGRARAATNQSPRFRGKRSHLSQLDRNGGGTSSNTEIPFTATQDMDDWRYAMIDEVPLQRRRNPHPEEGPRSHLPPCLPGNPSQWRDWKCLQLAQRSRTRPQTTVSGSKPQCLLTGPTAKMPKIQGHVFPEWPNLVPLDEKQLHDRKDNGLQTKTPISTAGRIQRETVHPPSAFFSGPRLPPKALPGVQRKPIKSTTHGEIGVSLHPHHDVSRHRAQIPPSHLKQLAQEQGATVRPVQPSSDPSPLILAQPSPRRYQSLPAELLAPELPKTTEALEPLMDSPLPNVPSTPFWDTCRPPIKTGALEETPAEAEVWEKGVNPPPAEELGHEDSLVIPAHVTLCSRGFSTRKIARPNVPQRTSSIRSFHSTKRDHSNRDIMDRDVLRGLHVAASAACDEQINAFIHEKTGLHIRQFLANLMPFENLGDESLREAKDQRTRRRKAEMRMVKQRVRRSRQIREDVVASC